MQLRLLIANKFDPFTRMFCWVLVISLNACSHYIDFAPAQPNQQISSFSKPIYRVKQGDTLFSIGNRMGLEYQKLALWNNIHPPYALKEGQKLKLFKPSELKTGASSQKNKENNVEKKRFESQKTKIIERNGSQKILTNSNVNKKMLKLNWQWPIKGKILKTFSKTGNQGIDIKGTLGQKIKSAAAGKVVYSGSGMLGYGKLLIIKHSPLFLSAYANNSKLLVVEGQSVNKGQAIAEVGLSLSKQASLHFEIRKKGNPVNPINFLPKQIDGL